MIMEEKTLTHTKHSCLNYNIWNFHFISIRHHNSNTIVQPHKSNLPVKANQTQIFNEKGITPTIKINTKYI